MIDTADSTFEFAREWLLSSQCVLRDVLKSQAADLGEARNEVRGRIHRDEVFEEPNEDESYETAPDAPPPINDLPRIIIEFAEDDRDLVGTGTFEGRGLLRIKFEVLVPEDYLPGKTTTNAEKPTVFASRKEWGFNLAKTCRSELLANSGKTGEGGVPYLNARSVKIETHPQDPRIGEMQNWMAFVFEVPWF